MMSREQYINSITQSSYVTPIQQFSDPKYKCPKCQKGKMRKDLANIIMLTVNPPIHQYKYVCDSCGFSETLQV